jgi:hypothetical protein
MAAEHGATRHFLEQFEGDGKVDSLAQALVDRDRKTSAFGEWLEGLDAAQIRTRHQGRGSERGESLGYFARLFPSARTERPGFVIAFPEAPFAGLGMPNEIQIVGHAPNLVAGVHLTPAEFVEAVVLDPGGVGDFVDHRHGHFITELIEVITYLAQREAIDRDDVGALVPGSFGMRYAFVQPEKVGFIAVLVLDEDDHIVEHCVQVGREVVERF